MDNSIFEMLSKVMSMGQSSQSQPSQPNPAAVFYPKEASSSQQPEQTQQQNQNTNPMGQLFSALGGNGENSMLPLLMSMMGKGGNPLAAIMGQNTKKEEESSSPSDEILL